MSRLQGSVVEVPSGTQFFTVDEIPKLLAAAKWPRAEGNSVTGISVLADGKTRPRLPEPHDLEAMNAIWAQHGLPEPEFPLSEVEWQRYVQVFDNSDPKPEWTLVRHLESAALNQAILRAFAEEQFGKALQAAIAAGQITVRDPLTHLAVTDATSMWGNEHLLVSLEDFSRLAQSAMLDVADGPVEPAAMSSTDIGQPETAGSPRVLDGQSRNAIGREIEDAIARIENRDTRAIVNQHNVMAELTKRVRVAGSCIIGVAEGNAGILWRDDEGQPQKLTKDAIRKRLQRRANVQDGHKGTPAGR